MACLPPPIPCFMPRSGTHQNFWMRFTPQKLEGWGYCRRKLHYSHFNRFWLIHPCDRQTDGQTTIGNSSALYMYSICCHALTIHNGWILLNVPVWLKRDLIVSCNFTQILFKFFEYLHVTISLIFRSKWMNVGHSSQWTWLQCNQNQTQQLPQSFFFHKKPMQEYLIHSSLCLHLWTIATSKFDIAAVV